MSDYQVTQIGAPGSVVRVGQNVWRTWRARPDSAEQLRWLCIRAGGEQPETSASDRSCVPEARSIGVAASRTGRRGDASNIAPMRVVRDDEWGLVAWLAAGTPWSVWLFWSEASGADWAFAGWCVNLENAEWSIPQLSDLPR